MSVTVKAFRFKDGLDGTPFEIRRFSLDQGLITNYAVLRQKISQVFPALTQTQSFSLYWKDVDGDFISFSSDDELVEALGNVNDVFRVYLLEMTNVEAEHNQKSSPKEHHPGVICDGCNRAVIGVRYKCVVCPDYDLCEACSEKKIHSEHMMIKIPQSDQFPFFNSNMFRGRHGGGRRHHHGPHHEHFNFGTRHGPFFGTTPPPPPPPHSGQGPTPPPGCPFGEIPFVPPMFFGMGSGNGGNCQWSNLPEGHPWRKFWRKCSPQTAQEGNCRQGCGSQSHQNKETQPENGCDDTENKPKAGENNDPFNCGEEYLKEMGETVAAFLEPFGIDVAVDIEHNGSHQRVNKTSPEEPPPRPSNEGVEKDQNNVQSMDIDASTGEPTAPSQPQHPSTTTTDITDYIVSKERCNDQGNGKKSDTEWTFVIPDDTVPAAALEPKIQKALDTMKTMGFSDDGGWLTRLLIAKDGDIVVVLDAIKPQPPFGN